MVELVEKIKQITDKHSILSNPYRIMIIFFVWKNKRATWSEIRDFVESNLGKLNPNTLQFHLKTLIESEHIKRINEGEKSIYTTGNVDESLIKEIKEINT
jgi:predicted transcriptional regulator